MNQDAFEGYPDTPPSLHKYLYAYANPTVYTDPTGNVAVTDELGELASDSSAAIKEYSANSDSGIIQTAGAITAGAVDVLGGVIELTNFGLNLAASKGALGSGSVDRAKRELDEAWGTLSPILENPKGTAIAAKDMLVQTSKDAANGDPKAKVNLISGASSFVFTGGVQGTAKALATTAKLTTATSKALVKGGKAVVRGGKAVVKDVAETIGSGPSSGSLAAQRGAVGRDIGKQSHVYNKETGQGVYVLRNAISGAVKYVGRGDAKARGNVHKKSSDKSALAQEILYNNNLTKAQAKFIEQKLMDHFGGAKSTNPATNLLNKIRSYSLKNKNAPKYEIAGESKGIADSLWQQTLKKLE